MFPRTALSLSIPFLSLLMLSPLVHAEDDPEVPTVECTISSPDGNPGSTATFQLTGGAQESSPPLYYARLSDPSRLLGDKSVFNSSTALHVGYGYEGMITLGFAVKNTLADQTILHTFRVSGDNGKDFSGTLTTASNTLLPSRCKVNVDLFGRAFYRSIADVRIPKTGTVEYLTNLLHQDIHRNRRVILTMDVKLPPDDAKKMARDILENAESIGVGFQIQSFIQKQIQEKEQAATLIELLRQHPQAMAYAISNILSYGKDITVSREQVRSAMPILLVQLDQSSGMIAMIASQERRKALSREEFKDYMEKAIGQANRNQALKSFLNELPWTLEILNTQDIQISCEAGTVITDAWKTQDPSLLNEETLASLRDLAKGCNP